MSEDASHETTLGELVELRTEKTTGSKDPRRPYVGLEHLAQGSPRLLGFLPCEASVSTNCAFETDDILFGKLRPNLRKSIRAPFPGYCSTDILVLRARDGVDPRFAAQIFQWEGVFSAATATAAGTKMPRTSWNELKRFRVFWPSDENEQSRIAAVLDTLDAAIAKTEAVIAKLTQVRAGLLHDLLARGLNHNGQLRDPLAHPEQFKDSPFGRIPHNWCIETVESLFEMSLGKMLSPKARLGGDSRPYVGNRHVLWDRCDCSDLEYMDFNAEERARFRLLPGDLLICEGGEVGRTAIWRGEVEECYFQKAIHRLRPRDTRVVPTYMLSFMRRAAGLRYFNNLTSQTSISHLTKEKLAILRIVVPPRGEQEQMAAIWATSDAELDANEAHLAKFRRIKCGLMSDLFTGRVRVPKNIELGAL
jgi:type I restriction enzyme S subunit